MQAVAHHLLEEVSLTRPFWEHYELFHGEPYSFLLDSAQESDALGRFSFLGGDPEWVYEARRIPNATPKDGAEIIVTNRRKALVEKRRADLFDDLETTLAEHRIRASADVPLPFIGGAVGYFGYECNYLIEHLPDRGADDLGLPIVSLMFVDRLLAHDHRSGKSYISTIGRGSTPAAAKANAERARDDLRARLARFEPRLQRPVLESDERPVAIRAHADEATYVRTVERAKDLIARGNCFEVCTTHRLEADFAGDAWELYRELRAINPAPFASFLSLPDVQVVSSSPERFLSLSRRGVVEARPIKGTRPRGATPDEDAALEQELRESPKDRAENVMIVDLVRNDIGRVCEIESVHVPELAIVEKYATVFQLVSTVRGQLRTDRTAIDLLKSAFPGGSMTGAPKIEAMKIIDELEPFKRGIYSGSIGYLDVTGSMDSSIVIRTIVLKGGRAYFSVGGAVLADSDPAAEYKETLDKAAALIRAIERASRGLSAKKTEQENTNGS